jgi:bifunctional UDP-N-acetylglucosamine pyrophosphorylase/glucosamine-1-phosphate N-acetyltransferase
MIPLAIIIMSAGKGTRMKSDKAKVLHELCGKPMIAFPVRLALNLKAQRIVVIVGHQAADVERAVKAEFPRARLQFALQAEQHGTAHAVLQAKKALRGFTGDVLILSGDVPLLSLESIRRFRRHHRVTKSALSVLTTRPPDPAHYGRCLIDAQRRLTRIIEYRDATPGERTIS